MDLVVSKNKFLWRPISLSSTVMDSCFELARKRRSGKREH